MFEAFRQAAVSHVMSTGCGSLLAVEALLGHSASFGSHGLFGQKSSKVGTPSTLRPKRTILTK